MGLFGLQSPSRASISARCGHDHDDTEFFSWLKRGGIIQPGIFVIGLRQDFADTTIQRGPADPLLRISKRNLLEPNTIAVRCGTHMEVP
jgi:hypothetical protein